MFKLLMSLMLLFMFSIHKKYIEVEYRNNCEIKSNKILLLDYNFYKIKFFNVFLTICNIILNCVNLFWKTNSIIKIVVISFFALVLFLILIYVSLIIKKKIILEAKTFTYCTLYFTKEIEYDGLKLYCKESQIYIYKDYKKVVALNIHMKNYEKLKSKIINVNGPNCIIKK